MNTLIHLAETWWPLYAVHMIEISLFIALVWAVDRWLTLETRLRYTLSIFWPWRRRLFRRYLPFRYPRFWILHRASQSIRAFIPDSYPKLLQYTPGTSVTHLPARRSICSVCGVFPSSAWTGLALWKNAAFRRTLRSATPIDLAGEVALLDAPRNLEVYSKSALPSPILVGLLKPRLFLPTRWSSWSSEELRGVVRHELSHFERRDIHVLILQAIATALFCANPLDLAVEPPVDIPPGTALRRSGFAGNQADTRRIRAPVAGIG